MYNSRTNCISCYLIHNIENHYIAEVRPGSKRKHRPFQELKRAESGRNKACLVESSPL